MTNGFAFGGGMGVGKTTAARYLVEEHGFVQIGFATPLYELGELHRLSPGKAAAGLLDWTSRNLGSQGLGWDAHRQSEFVARCVWTFQSVPVVEGKNRTLLQLLGTEVGRVMDPDLWTKLFEKAAGEAIRSGKRVVNDNLRFENELESARRLNLTTVFFEVAESVQDARYLSAYGVARTPEQKVHASESELAAVKAGCDEVFVNDGSLDDLRAAMDYLVSYEEAEV